MATVESLSHTRWECKYHLVWVPKYRRKVLYGQLRKHLGQVLHDLAAQRRARFWKGICRQIMCICWCRFLRSTPWLRW